MLGLVVLHFFVDGAVGLCQAEGICEVRDVTAMASQKTREFTCQECIQGMEYVEALMKDPLFVDMMVLRLEQVLYFLAG